MRLLGHPAVFMCIESLDGAKEVYELLERQPSSTLVTVYLSILEHHNSMIYS